MSPVSHSALGASTSKRWLACPASVKACASVPQPPPGKAALAGTAAHAWAEYALANGESDVNDYIGVEHPSAELAEYPLLTKETADAVNVYLSYVWGLIGDGKEFFVERAFKLDFIWPGMFGTNDCSVLDRPNSILHVVDYKHGAGVFVDAEDNSQLKYYALGALAELDPKREIKRVAMTIVQPRAGGEPVRTFLLDALDIWEFAVELYEGAERTEASDAPFAAGEHCRFCPAAPTCAEFARRARAVAHDGFEKIVEVEALPADDLAARLAEVDILKMWIKRIEEFANSEAMSGRMPRGFKWVAGRGSRVWALDEKQVIAAVKSRAGVDLSETVCASPAAAEKLVGKKKFADLSDLVSRRNASPSLVRESDKRPGISLDDVKGSAADGFEIIET